MASMAQQSKSLRYKSSGFAAPPVSVHPDVTRIVAGALGVSVADVTSSTAASGRSPRCSGAASRPFRAGVGAEKLSSRDIARQRQESEEPNVPQQAADDHEEARNSVRRDAIHSNLFQHKRPRNDREEAHPANGEEDPGKLNAVAASSYARPLTAIDMAMKANESRKRHRGK